MKTNKFQSESKSKGKLYKKLGPYLTHAHTYTVGHQLHSSLTHSLSSPWIIWHSLQRHQMQIIFASKITIAQSHFKKTPLRKVIQSEHFSLFNFLIEYFKKLQKLINEIVSTLADIVCCWCCWCWFVFVIVLFMAVLSFHIYKFVCLAFNVFASILSWVVF